SLHAPRRTLRHLPACPATSLTSTRAYTTRRPPPTSTLVPYTTLFRSSYNFYTPSQELLTQYATPLPSLGANGLLQGTARFDITLDRKSTRLNSSHVKISYAVFCLKKKKMLFLNQTSAQGTVAVL